MAAVFDDPNLVSCAGLVPLMRLAENVDLAGLVDERVALDVCTGAHPGGKVAAIGEFARGRGARAVGDLRRTLRRSWPAGSQPTMQPAR